jgi:hypothetical protein
MKKIVLIPVMVLFLAGVSCNFINQGIEQVVGQTLKLSGNTKTEQRPVSDFTRVQLDGIGDLSITKGDTESLAVEADENLLPYIITEVKNGTLIIRMKEGIRIANLIPTVKYTVTAKSLEMVNLNGLGNIKIAPLQTDALTISLDGSGAITVDNLTANGLQANLNGLGGLTITGGKVTAQQVSLAGAGAYQAGNLESETASISLTGLGSATVWVTGTLDAELTGAGSLDYYGNPQVTSQDTGLGSIKSLGAKQSP